jgi:hypothetical protein
VYDDIGIALMYRVMFAMVNFMLLITALVGIWRVASAGRLYMNVQAGILILLACNTAIAFVVYCVDPLDMGKFVTWIN